VPWARREQTSPLQALVHEFLQTPEMAWMKETIKPMDFEKWVARYPVKRQEELRLGREEAMRKGLLDAKDAKVSNFIKIEPTVNLTDPRNIVPREDVFMSVLGPFIAAVEHKAHKAPFLVKGINLRRRDRKMAKIMLKWKRFIEIDYARFDMTIFIAMLEAERTMVLSQFPRQFWPEVHRAYDLMLKTVAKSSHGTKYTKEGGRQSGDLTTSIGNGLLNRFAVWFCLRKLPSNTWESLHEGDDGLIGCSEEVLDEILENLNHLWVLGFQGKIDVYNDISQTSFCGRFLATSGGTLKSYADPLRTLAKLHLTCANGDPIQLICAKAMSYKHTDAETPVIGPWARAVTNILLPRIGEIKMRQQMERLLSTNELPWSYKMAVNKSNLDDALSSCPGVVDEELRSVFAMRTGISIKQQLDLEECFAVWERAGEIFDNVTPVEVKWVYKPNCHYNMNPDIR